MVLGRKAKSCTSAAGSAHAGDAHRSDGGGGGGGDGGGGLSGVRAGGNVGLGCGVRRGGDRWLGFLPLSLSVLHAVGLQASKDAVGQVLDVDVVDGGLCGLSRARQLSLGQAEGQLLLPSREGWRREVCGGC